MIKILITDGANKNTLSILRHLDHREIQIDVTSNLPKLLTLCSYSRFCKNTIYINSNPADSEKYAEEIIKILKTGNYDVFIPVGLSSNIMASKFKNEIQSFVNISIADWKYLKIAANKDLTLKLASNIGLPIPKTFLINDSRNLYNIIDFPVVIKSSDGKNFIKYCNNNQELLENYKEISSKSRTQIICQEYIEGFGCGFFGVYHNGDLRSFFLHKRLKEFPISGGSSAVAESFFDRKLYQYGKKICDELKWNGPIMVEFKYDLIGKDYKLIEINPKLWGSLDLTIEAGINIPDILIQSALNTDIDPILKYKYIKYRWIFPDEFKVLISNLSFKNIKDFIKKEPDTVTNFYLSDPLPTMFQIARSLIEGLSIILDRNKRYPHGIPYYDEK